MNLQKPAPGSGRLERFERRLERRALKAKAEKLEQQQARARDKAIRFGCFLRDRKRCRAFGTLLQFETDNLLKRAENHHIIPKSAGGSDDASNRLTLSVMAHRMRHEACLDITGDANGLVTFTSYTFEGGTRRMLRTWESEA